jgi:hypothetical protein
VSSDFSVSQILASLEAQMALHREKEVFHAEQEAFHREQRAVHAAEYEKVARGYDSFKASAGEAAEIAARAAAAAPPAPPPASPREELPPGKTPRPHLLVAKVVADLPVGEVFGCSRLTKAVSRRFGHALKKPLDPRLVSTILRRMAADGRLRVVQKGMPHREAMYTKG